MQELEKKTETLKKTDSLAKDIQSLKNLIEEVSKAREKKRDPLLVRSAVCYAFVSGRFMLKLCWTYQNNRM